MQSPFAPCVGVRGRLRDAVTPLTNPDGIFLVLFFLSIDSFSFTGSCLPRVEPLRHGWTQIREHWQEQCRPTRIHHNKFFQMEIFLFVKRLQTDSRVHLRLLRLQSEAVNKQRLISQGDAHRVSAWTAERRSSDGLCLVSCVVHFSKAVAAGGLFVSTSLLLAASSLLSCPHIPRCYLRIFPRPTHAITCLLKAKFRRWALARSGLSELMAERSGIVCLVKLGSHRRSF